MSMFYRGRSMESVVDDADRLIEIAEHGSLGLSSANSPCHSSKTTLNGGFGANSSEGLVPTSLEQRLLQLHVEEAKKEANPVSANINPCSNLLSLLCKRESFNRLILTLHPDDEGYYTIHSYIDSKIFELCKLSYDEDDFLTCIDNQELPVNLLDLFDTYCPDVYYSGCIIVEMRDKRKKFQEFADCSEPTFVILKPTSQSLICDMNLIVERSGLTVTAEDRAWIMNKLLNLTQPSMCIDPSPVVSVVSRKTHSMQCKFASPAVKRALKKITPSSVNRKRKLDQCSFSGDLKIYDFIVNLNKHIKVTPQEVLLRHQATVRANARMAASKIGNDILPVPPVITQPTPVMAYARQLPSRMDSADVTPKQVEEYILETVDRSSNKVYHTRLTILQRPSDDEYIGELYVERDYKEADKKGSSCRFTLGTRANAVKYIHQFTEIFTEEGRKSVKITHKKLNLPPRITFTAGLREKMHAAAQAAAAAATAAAAQAAAVANPPPGAVAGGQGPPTNSNVQTKFLPLKTNIGSSVLQQPIGINSVSVSANPVGPQQLPLHPVPLEAVGSQMLRSTPLPQQISLLHSHLTMPQSQQQSRTGMTPQAVSAQDVTTARRSAARDPLIASSASPSFNANANDQEQAISLIMASLIKDTAQFEQKQQQSGSPQIVSQAQLPTCPVPQASLEGVVPSGPSKSSIVTVPVSSSSSVSSAKSGTNRITLQNLLSAPSPGQIRVTTSHLATQLTRPSSVLPSYTQALAQTRASSPTTKLVQHPQQGQIARSVPATNEAAKAILNDSPGLQALLANTPSSDNPNPSEGTAGAGSRTLLERLMLSQPVSTNSKAAPKMSTSSRDIDSPNEITLASLLAKPTHQQLQPASTAKISPLLQQLQQPIPPLRPSLSSPQKAQPPSPSVTSPRPHPSPRMVQSSKSPASFTSPQPSPRPHSALQQHLMQPPKNQTNSILSAQLQQPLVSSVPLTVQELHGSNVSAGDGVVLSNQQKQSGNLVNLQSLLQKGKVQVSTADGGSVIQMQAIKVTSASSSNSSASTSTAIPYQLSIPGLSSPVTLSVSVPEGQVSKAVMTSLNKIINNTGQGGTQTVILQSAGGNLIQIPQQGVSNSGSIGNVMKPLSNQLLTSGGQLLVRQSSVNNSQQVLLQMPTMGNAPQTISAVTSSGQPIQLVRSVQPTIVRQPQPSPQHIIINPVGSLKSPQSSVPPSPSSVTSPRQPQQTPPNQQQQILVNQDNSNLVAIQLPSPSQQILLGSAQGTGSSNAPASSSHIRVRHQRKQSLK